MKNYYLEKTRKLTNLLTRGVLAVMLVSFSLASAMAQDRTVSGTITDDNGEGLPGVNVIIKGTSTGTVTDLNGGYQLSIPEGATLVFSSIGFATQEIAPGSRSVIDVTMAVNVEELEEVVVTGYTSERKADIIGSVEVIDTDDMLTAPAANVAGQLQGRAAGVVVSNDGRPGAGAKVRIRGFTSFGQSNPLYIIDGVPTKDATKINPQDIESVQVLKDATAASIYGARAAQGVIIITTRGGKQGSLSLTYDMYYGTQTMPQKSIPELLNTEEYAEYLNKNNGAGFIHPVFGDAGNPTIPERIVVSPGFKGGVAANDPLADPTLYDISDYGAIYQIMETSDGTNWFDETTRAGIVQNHQITASGGSELSTYAFSLNYFGQEGVYKNTDYNRYSARMNTSFTPKDWITIGENFQFIYEKAEGPTTLGEASPFGWAYRMVPYIPVYDIGGGFGGNAVGESGNASNPWAELVRNKDDYRENYKMFGNAFLEISPLEGLKYRTSFGIDYGNFFNYDIARRTYENSENTSITGLNTSYNYNLSWTFTNTLSYERAFGQHTVKLLGGTEAISFGGNGIGVSTNTFDFEDANFINLNTDQFATPAASSNQPTPTRLASYFGRVDYIFNDRYLFNATIRRDGTSKIHEDVRYGTFPAFGVGWRISEEGFMSGVSFIDDLKIRAGWGQMGSIDNVSADNQFTTFGSNIGTSSYDINRTNSGAVVGYTPYRSGSIATVWEFSETTNIGIDGSALQGKLDFGFNYFINDTKDLLVQRVKNGVEPQVQQPYVNLGQMTNKGFEFSLTNRNQIGDLEYDATLLFTRYTNEVVDIDGNPQTFFSRNASRLNNVARTSVGEPVSYFYGYQIEGFFNSQAEIDAANAGAGDGEYMPGAVIGSWRYKDISGPDGVPDGDITEADQIKIGSPHPDFITSLNLDLRYKAFDFNVFFVWNQGNELYNYNKYFTEMRVFVGGVSKNVLTNGWTPEKPSGDLPYLAPGAQSGYTSFTRSTSNDHYVENGSFLRLRTMQIGYNFDASLLSKAGISRARVYVQGQNLLTVTGYTGPDPDANIVGQNPNDDLKMGVDESGFPTPRQVIVGLSISL